MAKKTKRDIRKDKPRPELDPVRKDDLRRLSALDSLLSPFWSSRSGSRS